MNIQELFKDDTLTSEQKQMMANVLSNDEWSDDGELLMIFIENGVKVDTAKIWIKTRNFWISNVVITKFLDNNEIICDGKLVETI